MICFYHKSLCSLKASLLYKQYSKILGQHIRKVIKGKFVKLCSPCSASAPYQANFSITQTLPIHHVHISVIWAFHLIQGGEQVRQSDCPFLGSGLVDPSQTAFIFSILHSGRIEHIYDQRWGSGRACNKMVYPLLQSGKYLQRITKTTILSCVCVFFS